MFTMNCSYFAAYEYRISLNSVRYVIHIYCSRVLTFRVCQERKAPKMSKSPFIAKTVPLKYISKSEVHNLISCVIIVSPPSNS